jgi:hypothetical protein
VREESHLDDMRAAIRGDFERLAQRRGGQELMREPPTADESADEPASEPASEPEPVLATTEPEPELAPEPEAAPEPAASAEVEEPPAAAEEPLPDESPEEAPRRSFLDRLLGR